VRRMTRKIVIAVCACAFAAAAIPTVGASAADGGGTTATTVTAKAAVPAPPRYRTAYKHWRARLRQHHVWVGRNLLARPTREAVAAGNTTVTKDDLRHSIHRMQKRWAHWLRASPKGRAVAFKLKVRRYVPSWGKSQLRNIAWCESKNNPRAIGGGGAYRGMYQFSFSTWSVVGGSGDPAAASRWEQTWRAWLLLSRHGSGHWPVCG
jgi:Transglycosylase-like domain